MAWSSRHRVGLRGKGDRFLVLTLFVLAVAVQVEDLLASNYQQVLGGASQEAVVSASRLRPQAIGPSTQQLGKGQYGSVQLCEVQLPEGGGPVAAAVKVIRRPEGTSPEEDERMEHFHRAIVQLLLEASLMVHLKHPNVVAGLGVQDKYLPVQLVLEYCPHGSLLGFVQKHRSGSSFACRDVPLAHTDMLAQMASGVAVCVGGGFAGRRKRWAAKYDVWLPMPGAVSACASADSS